MKTRPVFLGMILVGCLVAALTISFAFTKNTGEVSLVNHAGEPIDQATVEVCGQRLDFSGMAPGEMKTAKFKVGADSDYAVSIVFRSGLKIDARVGYITSGVDYDDRLVVTENHEIVFRSGVGP